MKVIKVSTDLITKFFTTGTKKDGRSIRLIGLDTGYELVGITFRKEEKIVELYFYREDEAGEPLKFEECTVTVIAEPLEDNLAPDGFPTLRDALPKWRDPHLDPPPNETKYYLVKLEGKPKRMIARYEGLGIWKIGRVAKVPVILWAELPEEPSGITATS